MSKTVAASVGPEMIAQMAAPPVRIVIPAKVAFNLNLFQKTLQGVAERLGCTPCLSGRNCLFLLERDFVVDPQSLDVRPSGGIVVDL